MKKIYGILLIMIIAMLCLIASPATVFAVQANSDPFPFTQPDGTLISVRQFGDEFLHWAEDNNGNLIIYDFDLKGYCNAYWTDDGAVSTGVLVGAGTSAVMFRAAGLGHVIPQKVLEKAEETRAINTEGLDDDEILIQALATAIAADAGTPPVYASVDSMKRKMLMMHVTFEDRGNILTRGGQIMPKMDGKQIYDLCFGLREEVDRSVNGYYQDMLMTDEVVITPAEVLVPMDGYQGVIEVVMPGRHPHWGSNDSPSFVFMRDAMVKACAENLINLKSFDLDGNGNLATAELAIGMIIDGFEYSMGNIIPNFWGVSISSTPAANLTQDIKIASLFAQGAFHRNTGDAYYDAGTPGVIVHEMGHSGYSFQDTYDTGGLSASSGGLGYWSMQASGDNGRLPGEFAGATSGYQCAYNLVRSGFVIPGTIAYGENVVLDNHLDIYLVQTPIVTPVENTPVTNSIVPNYRGQYFLLQQRKFGDTFNYDQGAFAYIGDNSGPVPYDASIGGLLIQHVDLNVPSNRISNKPGHYRAAYEEAHGGVMGMQQRSGAFGRRGDFGDLWGVTKHEFSHKSDPGSGIYDYGDGRVWVNALTPQPHQNTPSHVTISNIFWDPVTLTTSLSLGNTPAISVASALAAPGDVVEITYSLEKDAGLGLSVLDIDIPFDRAIYAPVDVIPADQLSGATFSFSSHFINGVLRVTITDDKDIVGSGELFTVIYKVSADAPTVFNTPLNINFREASFITNLGKDSAINVIINAGALTSYDYNVYLKPDKTGYNIGDTVLVDVMLAGRLNYTQANTLVSFDADLLAYDGFANLGGIVAEVKKDSDGNISLRNVPSLNMLVGAPCVTPVKLGTLKFTVIGSVDDLDADLAVKSVLVNPVASVKAYTTAPGKAVTIKYLTAAEVAFLDLLDYDHVDYLAHYISEEIGNRITFSPRRDMCVDWIVDELKSYGYAPTLQVFDTGANPTSNGLIWIGDKHYVFYGPAWSADTIYKFDSRTEVEITGVATISWANQSQALTVPAGDYKDKAVFVTLETVNTGATGATMPSAANAYNVALALQEAGAAAVLFQTPPGRVNPNGAVNDTTYGRLANTVSGTAITIPVGTTLNYETSGILATLGAATELSLNLYTNNNYKNVVATIPSATGSKKTVYITSHHDTTGSGPGLNDNGSGVFMSLEMARAFKDVKLDANLVFVFFDAEEGGMRGSNYFVSNMTAEERENFVANYNMDMIATSQANCEWMFMNISDARLNTMQGQIPSGTLPNVAVADNPMGVKVAEEYGIYTTTMRAADKMDFSHHVLFCYDTTTDHIVFFRAGMINAVEYDWRSNRRGSGFETLYHKAGDTYEYNYSGERCQIQGDIISLAIYYAAQGK